MTANILVGTCSWADKTLIDSGWYPKEAKSPADRLRYYADQFPIVEVDSTYYAIPPVTNGEAWAERTPPDFTFDIKAYSLFTQHPAQVSMLPKEMKAVLPLELVEKRNIYMKEAPDDIVDEAWKRFNEALLPLDSAGKLGTVLFQFPPWFLPSTDNREYILEVKERLGQYQMSVEFRNSLWMADERRQERTLTFLSDNGLPYVCVDEPQGFKSSMPAVIASTAAVAIMRLHGRNKTTWEKKGIGAADRFDYLYSDDELGELLPGVRQLAERAREVHVMFNNCHGDNGVRNARAIAEMLGATREAREQALSAEPEDDPQKRLCSSSVTLVPRQ